MNNISASEARTFILASVVGASTVWDIAFNLGVYDTIFFEKIFFLWSASLAVFLASLALPDKYSQIRWWGRLILIAPTLWVGLALIDNPTSEPTSLDSAMLLLGLGLYAVCLPYTLYFVGRITNPEFFELHNRRLLGALVGIVFIIGILGFFVGQRNDLFLSCDDFKVSGNDIPANCTEVLIDPLSVID